MASSNNALRVADLDFFSIKDNLKNYLRSQSQFTDYDFDGSGMSVLIDLLAYNTYYNSFYLNMVANESFIDTAQFRQNLLSHAKAINYVPQSAHGSISVVNVKVTPTAPSEDMDTNYIVLDKYTRLLGQDIDGVNYPFVTINSNTSSKNLISGTFDFANVVIQQGEVVTLQYTANTANPKRRFTIPSQNVDTTSIVVSVQESASNTHTTSYNLYQDLTQVTANSTVYFIEEDENLNYTIYFGDDVIGKRPANDNVIIVTYLDTVGSIANNISNFIFTDPVADLYRSNVRISATKSSYGGTDKETLEQIRFRAPYHYTVQNRAVTENDYQSLITRDYNNIESISVWGGEKNDPPVYGKVYMSMKTKGYYSLTEIEKDRIKNELINNKNMLTIIPEIVDPDYVFILVRGLVTYNSSQTSRTGNEILNIIRNSILDYSSVDLNTFKSTYRKSTLEKYIDNCEDSITGSDIYVYLQKQADLELNTERNYEFKFNTPLRKGDSNRKLYTYPQITVADNQGVAREVFYEEVPESLTGISNIVITNPGMNYYTAPTVTITGDGSGATATATIVNGKVSTITIVNKGSNYTRASVSLTGAGGSEATARAKVESRYGTVRSYYYKPNGEKVIVNSNAGTIDYDNGKVTLTSLVPISVARNQFYALNVLTMNVLPLNEIISPLRNRILSIDFNDSHSIQLEMVPEN